MKHLSGHYNMFETETWYFRGDMKILLGHLNWGLNTNGRPSDSADNIFFESIYC